MTISTKLLRIAKMAKDHPERAFTTLAHHIDPEFLREAFRLTRKDGAPGIDGVTAVNYERDLEQNLQSLLDRVKSGRYRAPAVRRVDIPKGDGRTRPLGIPTFEDKVLQRAVAMLLEAPKLWRKWLMRRSGGSARKNWDWWNALIKRYPLPPARAVHSVFRRT